MQRVLLGFRTYFAGLAFWLKTPSLVRLSLVPLLIDGILFGAGLYSLWRFLPAVLPVIRQPVLYYIAAVVVGAAAFMAMVIVVFLLAKIIALPFHDALSEKTLRLEGTLAANETSGFSTRNIFVAVKKLFIFLPLALFLFVMGFVPFIGQVAAFLGLLVLTYDILDYSFDHKRLSLKQRLSFFTQHLPEFTGFALALGLTFLVPLLNFFILPGSIIAGSRLYAHLLRAPKNERLVR